MLFFVSKNAARFFTFLIFLHFLISLPFSIPLVAKSQTPSSIEELSENQTLLPLYRLIEVTEQNLKSQKHLLSLIEQYNEAKDLFFKNDQDMQNINNLVALAQQMQQRLQQLQIQTIFPIEFIEEITIFAQLASKQQIAKP